MFRDLLIRILGALFPILSRIESKLDRALSNQQKEESIMATAQETLDRIVQEDQETHQKLDGLLGTVQEAVQDFGTWPDKIKAAVAEALANNPGIDLSPLSAVADDMDAGQAKMAAAQQALQAAMDANKPQTVPSTPSTGGEQTSPSDPQDASQAAPAGANGE